ncbi:hypothetical protein [uncultured Tessaracoccus sp.]|uniref:hypothetical protein n=1 Tax=uncultured Tessaracoccus sp. TaxID=905023 RepID=UPI00261696A5|nr:hypothetical protein [uncultured Tessaracoccus sp.]
MTTIKKLTAAALAIAATGAATIAAVPQTAQASDPRPCVAVVKATKTDTDGQPLAGATFDVAAPNGSVIVPADRYYEIFEEHLDARPGEDAYLKRIAPFVETRNKLEQVTVPTQDWSHWYNAEPERQALYMESWRDSDEAGEYREALTKRAEIAEGMGEAAAEFAAAQRAGLDALERTMDPSISYADWVTAHKAMYEAVSASAFIDPPEMTEAEKQQDTDARAAIVARYTSTATVTSDESGAMTYAVWNPNVLLGNQCEAASITSTMTETEAPAGYELLTEPVTVEPQTTDDDTDLVRTLTVVNERTPDKPDEPKPTPTPKPEPTPEPTPDKPKPDLPEAGV